MSFGRPVLFASVTWMLATLPVLAHHSLDVAYDRRQTVTLQGTVTKMDWSNPHVHLFVDVADAGHAVNWQVEMGSPNGQLLRGWKIDTLRPGDHVVVKAYRARDGSHLGFAIKITKAGP